MVDEDDLRLRGRLLTRLRRVVVSFVVFAFVLVLVLVVAVFGAGEFLLLGAGPLGSRDFARATGPLGYLLELAVADDAAGRKPAAPLRDPRDRFEAERRGEPLELFHRGRELTIRHTGQLHGDDDGRRALVARDLEQRSRLERHEDAHLDL